jgi:hypothetical protein
VISFAAGDIVETQMADSSQWFPAVICQVMRGGEGGGRGGGQAEATVKLLVEYENTKMGSSVVDPKHVRICHDFDW